MQCAIADFFFRDVFNQCVHASSSKQVVGSKPDKSEAIAKEEDGVVAPVPTLRGVFRVVEEFGMVDAKCSVAKTLKLLASTLFSAPEDSAANLGNLQVPVTFPEFVSVMRALAATSVAVIAVAVLVVAKIETERVTL
eukprot:3692975-Rhodomonas_salina.1